MCKIELYDNRKGIIEGYENNEMISFFVEAGVG